MKSSCIIATLNRQDDLAKCLNSMTKLSRACDEIIIVEQGDFAKTQLLIQQFNHLNIHLYFHTIASAAQARNKGIQKATGDILFFIDDDTELDKNYIKIALDYFANQPQAMGITGKINTSPKTQQRNIKHGFINRFKVYYKMIIWKMNKWLNIFLLVDAVNMSVSRSGSNSHSIKPYQHIADIEWMQGASSVYRKSVFNQFSFNEHFIRWSLGEDVMLSYQVYRHYGIGALKYLPELQLTHYESDDVVSSKKQLIKMQIIYRFIFWENCIHKQQLINLLAYLYGQIGYAKFLFGFYGQTIEVLKIITHSYWFLGKNYQAIRHNKIDYNAFIITE